MSAEIQNELIKICGRMITEKVIRSVIDEKKFYSIIVDATSDISGTEQLSLSIRHLSRDNNQIQIKEEFIGFTPLSDSSAKRIFEKIIEYLRSTGLDLTYLRGYDGCSVMSGHIGGVQKLISDTAPRALYVHCASHSLDLAICDACDDKLIQLFFGTIKTIIKFISGSPKRQNLLKRAIQATTCNIKRQKLAKLVDRRWVEKATSVLSFKQLFTSVMTLLEYLMENADAETGANARAYFKCIKDLDFIICLFVVSRIFAILKPYTEVLQSKNCDLAQCYDNIEEVAIYLAELKYDVTKFHELETELEHFAGENDITLTLPRTNKYENVSAYVKTIYETFIETTLTELGNRFSKHKKILANVLNLLPSYVVEKQFNDVKQAFDFYKDDLPSNDMNVLAAEFEMWQHKWKKTSISERPSNVLDSLNALLSIRSFYPNLYCLFELYAILPVTVSTAERSFSTMKRIKTTLRNSIGDERLSNLAIIHIHHDIASNLNVEDVINIFCKDKRRIKFTNK
ncbi:unnamed protein product [Rotaria sp. Silwood2]|nr:unnamed protein product [Rotaria sp. Silwood2]